MSMESLLEKIKNATPTQKIGIVLGLDIIFTTITYFFIPCFVAAIYNNIIIASPTTWYDTPQTIMAWCPIIDIALTIIFGLVLWFIVNNIETIIAVLKEV